MHGAKHIRLSLACINRIGTCFEESSAVPHTITAFTVSPIGKSFTSLVFLIATTTYDNISTRTIFRDSLCFPYKHVYSLYKLVEERCLLRGGKRRPTKHSAHNRDVLRTKKKKKRFVTLLSQTAVKCRSCNT
jgi:hypothetical protein